jgi:hypothetical protein
VQQKCITFVISAFIGQRCASLLISFVGNAQFASRIEPLHRNLMGCWHLILFLLSHLT